MKTKNITNVYRNLDLELLAGEKEYITQHREGGITYKMDYSTVISKIIILFFFDFQFSTSFRSTGTPVSATSTSESFRNSIGIL